MVIQRGLGTVPPASTLISTGITTAAGISAATGVTAGLLASIGIGAQAVPIVGTIIGGVALLIGALGVGNGCGATCTETTQIVNAIEPYMQQNVQAAQAQASANGGCLTADEQAVAIGNFQTLWSKVQSGCSQVGGQGGKQCLADRSPGGKYDWTSYYLTPIRNIPVCPSASATQVVASSVGTAAQSIASTLGTNPSNILIYGGLALGILLLMDVIE